MTFMRLEDMEELINVSLIANSFTPVGVVLGGGDFFSLRWGLIHCISKDVFRAEWDMNHYGHTGRKVSRDHASCDGV